MTHVDANFPGATLVYVEASILGAVPVPPNQVGPLITAVVFDNVTHTQYEGNSDQARDKCGF